MRLLLKKPSVNKIEMHDKLENLINAIVGNIIPDQSSFSTPEKLAILLGESLQALIFVTSIEDEFNITLDDDEIDLSFFQDINVIIQRIDGHLHAGNHDVTEKAFTE